MRLVYIISTHVIIFLLAYCSVYAQSKQQIITSPPTSMFSYYRLADSFTSRKDTIKASEYFLKINPYFFMSDGGATPKTIDTIFASFALTSQAKKRYKKIFDSVYRKPRTQLYKTFAKMLQEDQAIRHRLDSIENNTSEKLPPDFLNKVDSPHFEYLYQYVNSKGWPSIENGSLQASIIALHDHQRHWFYLSIVRKAVLDGIFEQSTYELMKSYFLGKNTQLWENIVATSNHAKIDISSTINFKIPDTATINKISTAIKLHCPIKEVFWVYETSNVQNADLWWKENYYRATKLNKSIMDETLHEPFLLNCHQSNEIWGQTKKVIDRPTKKMTLYLVY